jgi:uncharacterized protein YwqG
MSEPLRTFLVRHDLERWADRLLALERRSLRLEHQTKGAAVARLGGRPRLGAREEWPEAEGTPLSFIAEIDLAAAAQFLQPDSSLPQRGYLEFFYDTEQQPWGFDPADRGGWQVRYADDSSKLIDLPASLPRDGRFSNVHLDARVETTYPSWESWHLDSMDVDRDARFRYADALYEWQQQTSGALIHRLLGHPDEVQGDMLEECQLASNGIYVGGSSQRDTTRAEELARDAGAWRLLLQVDSDDDAGMMWGDVGRLFYWIRSDDLRERRWDRVWMVLQCS